MTLCSMGRFERKLIVVSVVVRFKVGCLSYDEQVKEAYMSFRF